MKAKNILLIDDADNVFALLSQKISSLGCCMLKLKCDAVNSTNLISSFSPALVIVYVKSEAESSCFEFIEKLKALPGIPFFVILENEYLSDLVLEANPAGIFIMPVHHSEIITSIKQQLIRKELELQLEKLEENCREQGHIESNERHGGDKKSFTHFDYSPIPICDEDYSEIKLYFNKLKREGVVDFRDYFETNLEEVKKCASLVRVNGINQEARKFLDGSNDPQFSYELPTLLRPESFDSFKEELIALAEGKTYFENEVFIKTANNEIKAIIVKIKITPGNEDTFKQVLVSFFDISERKIAEEKIRASLKEKEILLKEIHHRVKNNLQIISSLLNLQSEYITDVASKELFNDSLNRIRSMALIHERLYQSKNFSRINVPDYIKDVTNYLLRTYKNNQREIKVNIDVENLGISIEVAIPLGLLINELVSNSLKYAFANMPKGNINIKMAGYDNGSYRLVLNDDGIGIPEHIDFRNTKSLGLQLVNNLVEQLGGSIELDKTAGTCFTIDFNINEK